MLNCHEAKRSERIIVAFDCDRATALGLAEQLRGCVGWVKVGMTLFYQEGPSIVQELKSFGFKVFLDLKLHDIPHQAQGAAKAAALSGADMLTMHASGGLGMMKAAQAGVMEAGCVSTPLTLAVTVLTSMNQATLHSLGVEETVESHINRLALLAQKAGLSGVVASPWEARMLRDVLGSDACIVTPGIRPAGSDKQDQSRVMTPEQAFEAGASFIVVGRPITQAQNPRQAFIDIAKGLDE